MKFPGVQESAVRMDGLRLLAIGRIPRCSECPRFDALIRSHRGARRDPAPLPAVPDSCTHQVCAPLAVRYGADSDDANPSPLLRRRAS